MIPVKGDVGEMNLGLSDSDRKMLTENVNIIYNLAASVRFDDFLKDTVIMNVRGTREVVKLALDLEHISLFVHVSTTYCNSDKLHVEEKIYPPHADWQDAIRLAEECDEDVLKALTEKYIVPLSNTYTFSKSLGEHVVNDLCNGKIRAIIARPSVVTNTLEEPISGWNDNFNGPLGLMTACGKGILRTVLCNRKALVDYIPADLVTKSITLASHDSAINNTLEQVEVYNISLNNTTHVTQEETMRIGQQIWENLPFSIIFWYPRVSITQCWYSYYIQVLLFHMLPAFFVDCILRMVGKRPMLFSIQRKIYIAINILNFFMSNTFTFVNNKVIDMQKSLREEDGHFALKYERYTRQEIYEYFKGGKIGIAIYLLKEKFDLTGIESKRRLRRYWYADVAIKTIFFSWLVWIVFFKMNLYTVCYTAIFDFISQLNLKFYDLVEAFQDISQQKHGKFWILESYRNLPT